MKINQLIIIVCCVFVVSCNWRKAEPVEPENFETATPEVLIEEEKEEKSNRSIDISSYTLELPADIEIEVDIIEELYKEALRKNEELKALNDRILEIAEAKSDTLNLLEKYNRTNKNYWSDVKSHLNKIEDEALKTSTEKAFAELEKVYNQKIVPHGNKKVTIEQRAKVLEDKFIVMKLMITQAMMNNYQNNELLNIQSMEKLIEEYDILIKDVQAISQ